MVAKSQPLAAQQQEIWQSDAQKVLYAQLCNAFYQREVQRLVAEPNADKLRRQLKSLPYYIERAATLVANGSSPFTLDSQNGSWLEKQKPTPPEVNAQANELFYKKYAQVGLIVPVLINSHDQVRLRIDSIDQVSDNKLHCNELGWFDFFGKGLEQANTQLVKPSKMSLTAACCGHQWQFSKRCAPRLLSLREMLLAGNINWRNIKRPRA
ncbi:hypothetical protein OIZ54_06470 [Pseudoalteromonas sp. A3]|uniref:hypothetical protein n=1 Tax=Pseudoalteromonas TaxID=53246 RepID=UPI000BBCD447|nr:MULTISPECIES: hypothetical protein [Pseudoalteromonas]MCK8108484.1 hypothetical protein [Pseudoalteromonas sp. 2CM41L]MCK8117847.1 hypothetical protein [Pseudoalteromonas sp. 2CM37A]MCK8133167.1 hypothetical protein [Pseudoalteromonas sp. 2CM28B]MCW1718397.1 hypothetical protein [Pseudoalteromonas sp. A3]MDC9512564.1 hypothetical protein [Pseudoalteromonas sp. CST1]